MTLTEIGRMLKLAKVPRSKSVQHGGASGFAVSFIVHVPASHFMLLANVVGGLKLPTDNVKVVPLDPDCRDVPSGHVFYKLNGWPSDQWHYPQHCTTEREQGWYRRKCRRARHSTVVIDFASVALG